MIIDVQAIYNGYHSGKPVEGYTKSYVKDRLTSFFNTIQSQSATDFFTYQTLNYALESQGYDHFVKEELPNMTITQRKDLINLIASTYPQTDILDAYFSGTTVEGLTAEVVKSELNNYFTAKKAKKHYPTSMSQVIMQIVHLVNYHMLTSVASTHEDSKEFMKYDFPYMNKGQLDDLVDKIVKTYE